MLETLENQIIGEFRLHAKTLGRARYFDQQDFTLYLIDSHGIESNTPVFRGRYNAGRPSIFVPGWIDGEFVENARIGGKAIDLNGRMAKELARKLGELIPPGGRMWFAYEAFDSEGELMRETRAALNTPIPLVATPIGYLLFCADCWVGVRDWDIPEGGREGPRKLQGNKALNREHARQRAAELVSALEEFVHRATGKIEERAKERADAMLPALRSAAGLI